jgi:hypothetical protein
VGFAHGAVSTAKPKVALTRHAPIRLAHRADLERPGQLRHIQAESGSPRCGERIGLDLGGFGYFPA